MSALAAAVLASVVGFGVPGAFAQDDTQIVPPAAPAKPKPAAPKPSAPKPAAPTTPAKPATPAPAKPDAAKPDAANADAVPQQNRWTKLCTKDSEGKKNCLTFQELRDEKGQMVASVALREFEVDPKKVMLVAVPPLMAIQPGLALVVDKGKPEEGKYTICFPNACYAEVNASDALIQAMKKGQGLFIVALTAQNKQARFPFPLYGFKTSNEGPGQDPNELSKKTQDQEQLQQELQKRADEAAKALADPSAAPKP
eukprot:gene20571-21236_t